PDAAWTSPPQPAASGDNRPHLRIRGAVMPSTPNLPGRPGQPWTAADRAAWRAQQTKKRSYADEVLAPSAALRAQAAVIPYGELDYAPDGVYPLLSIRSHDWSDALPVALVTGGVHGYETSGVHGALAFARDHLGDYAGRLNVLVAPCVSPWAYERIHRWNPL